MEKKKGLHKELGLLGVFSMSTGAMFSSGFFLLPGLAFQYTGPSVFLAYLLSGLLIVPAMLCMAEIATAIPRAGGTYFFLDRAYGPLIGTVGGIGSYFALVLKSAFALIGLGAYSSLILDIPIKTIAFVLTIVFMIFNVLSAKRSSFLQNGLIAIIIIVLFLIIFDGLIQLIFNQDLNTLARSNWSPFFEQGMGGFFATIGFVFVSYAGLTKIASVSEEIKNPERNIPLGMFLSLFVTITIYVLGTFLMVSFIERNDFSNDLTPVATLTEYTLKWIPEKVVLYIIVVTAFAAFASTGNAGIMSSSRYPFAMSRDKLLPPVFGRQNSKTNLPVFSIVFTSITIIIIILFVSVEGIVKMASAFQLLIFFFINFAVIIFRKSKIEAYDPGYLAPFYPYLQIFGMSVSFGLLIYLGWVPFLLSLGLILLSVIWYNYYARGKLPRKGAILHWFELLGRQKYDKIENEFFHIIREKGIREEDQYEHLIANATVTILKGSGIPMLNQKAYKKILLDAAGKMAPVIQVEPEILKMEFEKKSSIDTEFVIPKVSISFASFDNIPGPVVYIVTSEKGITKKVVKNHIKSQDDIHVFFFIVVPSDNKKLLLRFLSRLLEIAERKNFQEEITSKKTEREVKEYLLSSTRIISITLDPEKEALSTLEGKKIRDANLPKGLLIAFIERDDESLTPDGDTVLMRYDRLIIIGSPEKLKEFENQYLF